MRDWVKMAKEMRDDEKARTEHAYLEIPKKYHPYIILLPQNKKLGSFEPDEELRKLGAFSYTSRGELVCMLPLKVPYVSVDGRIRMARDEHKEAKKKLAFKESVKFDVGGVACVQVTVESDIYGSASGTAKVNVNGTGAEKTNPVEVAETSAVGRALGFLGYGIKGIGIRII